MLIRFTVQTDERLHGAAYKVGQTVELSPSSAQRWLRRGVAVEVTPPPEGLRMRGRPMMGAAPEPAKEKPVKQEPKPRSRRGRPKKSA